MSSRYFIFSPINAAKWPHNHIQVIYTRKVCMPGTQKQVSVSLWIYEVLSNWYLYENDDMEQQDIQHNCGPNDHHPFLAFCCSKARLIRSAPARFCVVIIFRAAQEASVEPVPWCARFIGTAVKVSMQMVQPFQLLSFGVYISGQDFSLSLHERK